jgi:RNA polymerase sigma-70 factor (ECF subfamily)
MRPGSPKQFEQHLPKMYRAALRVVRDAEMAEEVVQEACVKALENAGRFNGRSSLATWLHRVTVNCAIDRLRKHKALDRNRASVDESSIDYQACAAHGPAMLVEQRELCERILAIVETLPMDYRSAFVLTQMDGYSYDMAAEIEQQPRGTIASRVYRAKKILFNKLSQQSNGSQQS